MPAIQATIEQVKKIGVDQYKYGFETRIEFIKAPAEASALVKSCNARTLPPAPTAIEAAAEYQQNQQDDDYQSGIIHGVLPRSRL